MFRRLSFLGVIVALAGATAALDARPDQDAKAAQAAKTAPAPDSGQVTFRSGVDLVRFDVRVVDGTGKPVTDLTPNEVEIYEDGRRLPVVLFERVSEPAGNYVDDAIRATTAEVSSNTAFPRGHLYILIFDQQHIAPGNEQRARVAAEEFIRRRVRPSDRVALFAIPGPGPQIGFTANTSRAINQLASIRGAYQRVPPGAFNIPRYEAHRIVAGDDKLIADTVQRLATEGTADLLGAAGEAATGGRGAGAGTESDAMVRRLLIENARTIVNQSDAESRQFLQRLADVIAGFREIEGRKSVVLFSEGFIQDNLSRELEAVAAAAAQSYCVFYTMDLNSRSQGLDQAYASDTTLSSEIQARIAPLSTLAVETDGAMFIDAANRTDTVLNSLADQAQDYYLVGFQPSEDARLNRGKYRRVKIEVKRRGARASARTGYTVAPEAAVADRLKGIETLLGAPFVQQGLKLDYTTYVLKDTEVGRQRVVLSLTASLPVRSKPTDAADVVFVVRDVRDGRVVASGNDVIPLPNATEGRSALGRGDWRVHFNVPPGSYLMRAVVREPGGLSGSADRRLEVKALDGPDVNVSDFVVGSAIGGLPVRAQVYAATGLTGAIETYARAASQLENLSVLVELKRQGETAVVTTMKANLLPLEQTGAGGVSQRASVLLPLDSIAPGAYVAHAIVRAGGETLGERTRQIDILAGTAPAEVAGTASAPAATWVPMQIIQGDLARKFVAALAARAKGSTAAGAAGHALANRWEQVEAETRRVTDTGATTLALLGLARFVREDYTGAVAALKAAREAGPDDALTAFFLGWAYEGAADRPAALGAWRSAVHLDPSLVSGHLALADGYLRMGQPALAVQALKAGLASLPSSPELLAKLQQIEGR
ncbi:MAG: VWA domain-containing protein [Acidobacteriota bacterium]|nr:VWA domain-containing protein [Acidobacteriota bacterium]